jgi:short-subunit dehydrogenase
MTTQITTALITGASSGIGAVYADRLPRAVPTWSWSPAARIA